MNNPQVYTTQEGMQEIKNNPHVTCYCAFHKHANFEVQKPTDDCVFAAVNHLNGTLRKQNFTFTGSKGHGL